MKNILNNKFKSELHLFNDRLSRFLRDHSEELDKKELKMGILMEFKYKVPVIFLSKNSQVVRVGFKYYFRHSELITMVENRYYRVKSNLIVKLYDKSYILKSDSVEMYDGFYTHKNESVISHDNFICSVYNSITYLNKVYTFNDKNVISYKNMYFHKNECVSLSLSFYNKYIKCPIKLTEKCYVSNDFFLRNDLSKLEVIIENKESIIYINKKDLIKTNIDTYLINISIKGSEYVNYEHRLVLNPKENKNLKYSDYFDCYIDVDNELSLIKKENLILKNKNSIKLTRELKRNISPNKSILQLDFSKGENSSKKINIIEGDIEGGRVYLKPNKFSSKSHFSQSSSLLGGKKYTFGLEHESCAGILPDYIADKYGLSIIGDGSTRFDHINRLVHYEYVSSVLHGDIGINKMYAYLKHLNKHILQNNKCSTHIHIGGNNFMNSYSEIPSFNRKFSALAIILGAQIENSLLELLPESRDPKKNRYCSSIESFKNEDISSKTKVNKLIASFVFGVNNLDSNYNSKTELNRWSQTRYKWLNLVNCNSSNIRRRKESFKTIEFRIFPPTTNPIKVHFWILICQAFVWFVENKEKDIIKRNINIHDVLRSAYSNHPIYDFVLNCIEKSKGDKFFKRLKVKKIN